MSATQPRRIPSPPSTASLAAEAAAQTQAAARSTTPPGDAAQREALIRQAAYAIYERRGFAYGHALEDWLEAEMEVDRGSSAGQQPAQ